MIPLGPEPRTEATPSTRCPWCGHPRDCAPATPGKSPHHRLCCLDQYNPECRTPDGTEARIMREDAEERAAS